MRDREHADEIKARGGGAGPDLAAGEGGGDAGKLFGSVTANDIVAAIKKAGGPNLDKRTVRLPKAHIKATAPTPSVCICTRCGGRCDRQRRRPELATIVGFPGKGQRWPRRGIAVCPGELSSIG